MCSVSNHWPSIRPRFLAQFEQSDVLQHAVDKLDELVQLALGDHERVAELLGLPVDTLPVDTLPAHPDTLSAA